VEEVVPIMQWDRERTLLFMDKHKEKPILDTKLRKIINGVNLTLISLTWGQQNRMLNMGKAH
jgi:hypothetical protein